MEKANDEGGDDDKEDDNNEKRIAQRRRRSRRRICMPTGTDSNGTGGDDKDCCEGDRFRNDEDKHGGDGHKGGWAVIKGGMTGTTKKAAAMKENN